MHPHGICISYRYDGDEARWERLVADFTRAVATDNEVGSAFNYTIHKGKDGVSRLHIGRWDKPETVERVQSRAYFKAFAAGLKELAGDTLQTLPMTLTHHS